MQRSLALELSGVLAATGNEESALTALDRAAAGASQTQFKADIAVSRVRVALRQGDFSSAGRLARDAIRSQWSRAERVTVAPLAALVGDVGRAERLAVPDVEADPSIPASLSDSLAVFRVRAILGACDGLEANRRQLEEAFRIQFSPSELAVQRQRRLLPLFRDAVPCLGVATIRGFQPGIALDRAYQAVDRKDLAEARRILERLRAGRGGATMAAITWDFMFAESWATMAAGDTTQAITQLRTGLADLANMSLFTLVESAQAAGLRRGMMLLAIIGSRGARTGNDVWGSRSESLIHGN
jgi:hypothetical protein